MTENLNLPTAPPAQETADDTPQLFIWDTANPHSLINVAPDPVREAMLRLVHERPDLCDLDEPNLRKFVREETGLTYSTTDNQLRFKFWLEFERAISNHQKMTVANITAMICSNEFFKKTFLKNNIKVCWMLCKPTTFMVKADEALSYGVDEMRDILSMPNFKSKGDIDYKLINAKISIFKMLDARVNGAAVQRTLNYSKSEHKIIDTTTAAEKERLVEQQIAALEAAERRNEKESLEILVTTEPPTDGDE